MQEPEWMQGIDSSSVCTWFYAFFIINSILAALAILSIGAIAFGVSGVPKGMIAPSIVTTVLSAGIAIVNSLFFYIICDRALIK